MTAESESVRQKPDRQGGCSFSAGLTPSLTVGFLPLSSRVVPVALSQSLVADGHHPVSHNNGVPEQVAKKAKIDMYHLKLFGDFLERLM